MWQASVLSVQDCTDMEAEQSLVLRSVAQHKQEDEASVSTWIQGLKGRGLNEAVEDFLPLPLHQSIPLATPGLLYIMVI